MRILAHVELFEASFLSLVGVISGQHTSMSFVTESKNKKLKSVAKPSCLRWCLLDVSYKLFP